MLKLRVFDLIGSRKLITRILKREGEDMIRMLFSGDHYDNLTPKNNENDPILL